MTRDGVFETVGSAAAAATVAARTALGLDTNPVPAEWTHVTKVDPEYDKRLPYVYPCYLRHTSAVSIGGSKDVTAANTEETFDLVDLAGVPAIHEPSAARHVTDRTREAAELLALPEVLNGDAESLVGTLGEGVAYIHDELVPAEVRERLPWLPGPVRRRVVDFATSWLLATAVFEAYIIQNPDSAAAREANVDESDLLDPETARQRAMAAERHVDSEIIYLEYSGTFGGDEAEAVLRELDDAVSWSRVWYGGGLDSRERVRRVLAAGADAVVVGDAFHDVAEAEADLYAAARDAFDERPDRRELVTWLDDRDTTAAARYLSTTPEVSNPERTAVGHLADGLLARFALDDLRSELPDDPSAREIRSAVERTQRLPGETAFEGVVEDPRAVAAEIAVGRLAADSGVDVDGSVAGEHVAGNGGE